MTDDALIYDPSRPLDPLGDGERQASEGIKKNYAKQADDPAFGRQLANDAYYGGPKRVRFDGYELDPAGFPTFRYGLTDVDGKRVLTVNDRPEPRPVGAAAGLGRTFTLERPAGGTVWLLVADGTKEPRTVGGKLVVPHGDTATAVQASAGDWRTVPTPGVGRFVLLRLPPGADRVTVTTWGLPRDDDALVGGLK